MPWTVGDFQSSIEQARHGPPQVIALLLETYREYMRLLARTSIVVELRGKVDPSDLAQETIIKAVDNFGTFRGQTEAELAGWLRSILAQNLAATVRRYSTDKRCIEQELSLDALVERSSQTYAQFFVARGDSPHDQAVARDRGLVLSDALSQLPADQREAIVLRSLEQLSWDEAAYRLNRTPNAARMLWTRALKSLRDILEGQL